MKLRRILFFALMLASGGLAMYTGSPLFYMLLFILCAVLVYALWSMGRVVRGLRYTQRLDPPVGTKGQSVCLQIELHNEHLTPFPYLNVFYRMPGTPQEPLRSQVLSLMPNSHETITENFTCPYRGIFPMGLVKVVVSDVFGLFSRTVDIEHSQEYKPLTLTIRPRIVSLPEISLPSLDEEAQTVSASHATQDAAQISDFRKAQVGDSARRIHWKLTMRKREIIVKNYEYQSMSPTLIYADVRESSWEGEDRLLLEDALIEHCAAIGTQILQRNMPLQLVSWGDVRREYAYNGQNAFPKFYSDLSDLRFGGQFPMDDFLRQEISLMQRSGRVFILAHMMDDKLFNLLMSLTVSGLHLSLVLVSPQADPEWARMKEELERGGMPVLILKPGQTLEQEVNFLR